MAHAGNKSKSRTRKAYEEALKHLESKWSEFLSLFKDEETCLSTFFDTVGVSLYVCPKCKSLDVDKFNDARTIKCRECNFVQWVTAGTFFHRIRLPLVWFGTLWLIAQGVSFNAHQLHTVTGVAPSTAWKIFKKVTLAIAAKFENDGLSIPTGAFGDVIFRRSCKTPADVHPREEEYSHDKTETAKAADDSVGSFSEQELMVMELLIEKTLNFDQLAARTEFDANELNGILLMLEINGLVKRIPGGWYQSRFKKWQMAVEIENNASQKARNVAEETIQYIKNVFQGVSRKYLQLFIAAYWCFADRKRWTLGALLQHCLDMGEVSLHEIRSYVTPPYVRLGEMPGVS